MFKLGTFENIILCQGFVVASHKHRVRAVLSPRRWNVVSCCQHTGPSLIFPRSLSCVKIQITQLCSFAKPDSSDRPLNVSPFLLFVSVYAVYVLSVCVVVFLSVGWTTAALRESSSSWCPVSCLIHITGCLSTRLMTPTPFRSAPCPPLWITTMNGEKE